MKNKINSKILVAILFWTGALLSLPNHAFAIEKTGMQTKNKTSEKEQFIEKVKKMAVSKNKQVLDEKNALLRFKKILKAGQTISAKDKLWIQKLTVKYQMNVLAHKDITKWTEKEWQDIDGKVDIVPISIIVSQAVHESNFGKSW